MIVISNYMMLTTRSWTTPTPREGRANPDPQEGRANVKPEKEVPTATQEKEGASPLPQEWERHTYKYLKDVILTLRYNRKPSHPPLSGSGPASPFPRSLPLRIGPGPLLSFLLAGPLAFPFSPFWLGLAFTSFGSGPGQPDPEGQPRPTLDTLPLPLSSSLLLSPPPSQKSPPSPSPPLPSPLPLSPERQNPEPQT